jgi:hypothetical protein
VRGRPSLALTPTLSRLRREREIYFATLLMPALLAAVKKVRAEG